jgi:UDP:flavonoid glycosyltransferase YjiC (YdhE family)
VAFAEEAAARGWDVVFSGEPGWFTDAFEHVVPGTHDVGALAGQVGADVVLVDHYGLPDMRVPGAVLVSMESGRFGRRPADVVVDSGLVPHERPDDGSGLVLRGPRYAPLRAAVRAVRGRRRRGTPPKVVVTMGGSYAQEAVAKVLRALRDSAVPADVLALAPGPVYAPDPQPGQRFTIAPLGDLPAVAADADLVVSAAGVTLLELCCIGLPSGLVQLVDNQARGYHAAVDLGAGLGLGTPEAVDHHALRRLLTDQALRDRLAATAAALVDGLGAARVLDSIPSRE